MELTIGEQLKTARTEQKLTRDKLSEMSSITTKTIYLIESNRSYYTCVYTLKMLQNALNIKFII